MVTVSDVKWVKYGPRRGPWFSGTFKFELPENPDENDRYIAVITAAEGGHYDAVNMYDRAVVSIGLIQWIEANQHTVSDLLGAVATALGPVYVNDALAPALALSNACFTSLSAKKWRFLSLDGMREIDSTKDVQDLFLGCDGYADSWTPESKSKSMLWASCLANVWKDPRARQVQLDFTKNRLQNFVYANARSVLFSEHTTDPVVLATRALYMQFAINNPSIANLVITTAAAATSLPRYTHDWCMHITRHLTLQSPLSEWQNRYVNVSATLEKIYGVKFPTLKELPTATKFILTKVKRLSLPTVQEKSMHDMVVTKAEPTPIKPETIGVIGKATTNPFVRFWSAFVGFFKIMFAMVTTALKR